MHARLVRDVQSQAQPGFRLNPLGMIGGIVALISLVLPWVTLFGLVSANLFSVAMAMWGSHPTNVMEIYGPTIALVFILLGGLISLFDPAGGVATILGCVFFLATIPYLQGVGPYIALLGGILALSGFFFRGAEWVIPIGRTSSVTYQSEPPSAGTSPSEPPPPPPDEVFCPNCGARYPGDYKLCPRDGAELKALR